MPQRITVNTTTSCKASDWSSIIRIFDKYIKYSKIDINIHKYQPTTMTTTQNNTGVNAMGSGESEDEWVCNGEVGGLGASLVDLPHTSQGMEEKLPLTNCDSLPVDGANPYRPVARPASKRMLPAVLVDPYRPAVKRIKTEYNRRVSAIRCSIPDAYHKIKNLNYEIRKLTAPASISRVRSELNKHRDIIWRAQCQMRTAHQEKKTKLEHIKTNAIFRYLTSKDKKAAKEAKFHQWSPFKKRSAS